MELITWRSVVVCWVCVAAFLAAGTTPTSGGKIPSEFRDESEMDALFSKKQSSQRKTAMDFIAEANLLLDKTSDKKGTFFRMVIWILELWNFGFEHGSSDPIRPQTELQPAGNISSWMGHII